MHHLNIEELAKKAALQEDSQRLRHKLRSIFTKTAVDQLEKESTSRWRTPENLLKILQRYKAESPASLGGYNRHSALQYVSDKFGLNKNIGEGYQQVLEKLNWRKLPDAVRAKLDATDYGLEDPRYLFRGIRPGKNISHPTVYDNVGKPADFVHAAPSLNTVLRTAGINDGSYAHNFGPTYSQIVQTFKPNKNQKYFQDFSIHGGSPLSVQGPGVTWQEGRESVHNFLAKYKLDSDPQNVLTTGPSKYLYETPISQTSGNRFLGNFALRNFHQPQGSREAYRRDLMLNGMEFARIPKTLTNKFTQMGLEANKKLIPEVNPINKSLTHPALLKEADLKDAVELQDHQQRIIDRMNAGDKRLLLYHGLGSGKSLSSLAAAEAAGGEYGAVTPASLRQNYEKEIEKFTEGTEPDVLSYSGVGAGKQFKKPVKTTIFDEAHRLRNPGTAAAQAAKRLAQNSENLLLLTGTPITNHPSDLASLLGLLHNKNISPEQFEKQFVGYKKVYPSFLSRFTGKGVGEQPYVKNEAKLRELLKGKIDYQPSKTPEGVNVKEEVVKVPLSTDQQRIQKAIKSGIPPEWSWKLNKEFPLTRDELKSLNSFLTGLRQSSLSTLPFRGDKKPLTAFEESGKLQQALKDLKDELGSDPRKKAITYSNYIDAGLSPYAAALEREKIPYGMFHGGIPLKQRKKTLQDYNEGKLRALLLGPAAAEGISTKGTNLIQLLDPHWHESRSSQARGRGLRFDSHAGLPEDLKNVAVKRYISESKEPSWLGRLLGSQRQRTGDEILQTLAADKEKLNDVFRKILQEEGTPVKAAAESVAYTLQNLVFGCLGLALQFKHCHWNVRGTMFKPLHDFLDEVHETLEDTSDDLAERLVTLDHPADGNPASVAAAPGYKGLPLKFMQPATIVDDLTDRLKSLCDDFNAAIKATDSDPVTSNMLQDMTHKLEKHLWMLRSQKEKADTAEKEAATAALSKLLGRSWLTVR